MSDAQEQLGRILVQRRYLTEDELTAHKAAAEASGSPLAQVLVDRMPNGRSTLPMLSYRLKSEFSFSAKY